MIVAESIIDLIGRTPMLRINRLTSSEDATLYAKLEWYNAGGSVKDRMALYLIQYAEATGRLSKGSRILEATSGNTGIALAMIAAAMGYRISIIMPESVSIERRRIIEAYGAELVLSPGEKGTGGAVELKQKLMREKGSEYVDIDQFKDPANILAHYQTTGNEILQQTKGNLDMVIAGVGTAGTGMGISLRVKRSKPKVKIVGVMPELGVKIQGLRNPREPFPTQLYKRESFDEIVEISNRDLLQSVEVTRRAAKEEGLLVGMSSGAILYVALIKTRELGKGKTIVAVLPDSGDRYLSTSLFQCEKQENVQSIVTGLTSRANTQDHEAKLSP